MQGYRRPSCCGALAAKMGAQAQAPLPATKRGRRALKSGRWWPKGRPGLACPPSRVAPLAATALLSPSHAKRVRLAPLGASLGKHAHQCALLALLPKTTRRARPKTAAKTRGRRGAASLCGARRRRAGRGALAPTRGKGPASRAAGARARVAQARLDSLERCAAPPEGAGGRGRMWG
ncbi:MAG: hypothetical protein J3K34DRAFT_435333 [Monoraphidium minutum]|nr:MAG: hypothetical protein J3K34DRAFT_435333 [Monoraphidium minutum]